MINVELTTSEADHLRDILENYLGDLRMEIAATDSKDFRDDLKETEVFIKDLLARLDRAA